MKIVTLILLIILAGCNGEVGSLSPISGISDGLYISPISAKSSAPDTSLIVPFQIRSSESVLTCNGSVSVTTNNTILFPSGGFSVSGSAPNCVLVALPGTGETGSAIITLKVREGTKSASTSFMVTIAPQVAPAVLDLAVSPNPQEGIESIITIPYTDANGDEAISCNVFLLPPFATVSTPCSCTAGACTVGITGTAGVGQFKFTVTDNDGISNIATGDFTIDPVNDNPVISIVSEYEALANGINTTIPFTLTDADSSVSCAGVTTSSGNTLVVSNGNLSVSGTAPNCALTIAQVSNAAGPVTITLSINDGDGGTGSDSLNFLLTGWGQTSYFKADAAVDQTHFGHSVAIDGNTMVVGAEWENSVSSRSGAAFVYVRSGDTWTLQQKLKSPIPGLDDNFGQAVSLSRDFLAVSAPREDSDTITEVSTVFLNDNSKSESGASYVYQRSGSTWSISAMFKAAFADASDYFGHALSLHHDRMVVSVPYDDSSHTSIFPAGFVDDASKSDSGAAYVYKFDGANWNREAYIKPLNSNGGDNFGWSVSLSGTLLAISAHLEDSSSTTISYPGPTDASEDEGASNAGAVYVYKWDGANWTQEAYIKAPNAEAFDYFGQAISLDGNKLAVAASGEDNDSSTIVTNGPIVESGVLESKGAVYIFRRDSANDWQFEAYIKPYNDFNGLGYAQSLALKGNTLVVGSPLDDYGHSGIVNSTTVPGAMGTNDSGSAHVYYFDGTNWEHEAYINPRNRTALDKFAHSVSISGDSIAIGSPLEDSPAIGVTPGTGESNLNTSSDSGAAYVYRNYSRLFEVTEYWATSGGSSLTVNFHPSGGSATGYIYRYAVGASDPGACDVLDTPISGTSFQLTGLTPDTDYTFRICAIEGSTMTSGRPFTVRTKSSGAETTASAEAL